MILKERSDANIYLDCDYGPCELLAKVADNVGLPKELFSIKSQVYLMGNRVSVRWGYSAPTRHYYPLDNGHWLITSLSGDDDDMKQLFDYVVNDEPMTFEIDFSGDGRKEAQKQETYYTKE